MIDTHCHLLPSVDDGCRDLKESLDLAAQLVRTGVRHVVCTPHFSRRYVTETTEAEDRLRELSAALRAAGIPLGLTLAAEVASATAAEASAESLLARRIGPHHILVELEQATPASALDLLLDRVEELNCVAVLAHPERCAAVRGHLRLIDAARERGALVQIVAPSLVGRWGREAATAAWQLVRTGRADLLASDAHRPRRGEMHLTPAIAQLARQVAPSVIVALTLERPAELLGAHTR